MLDDDVQPVNGNKLFGKGGGFKEPIHIEDGDDRSGAHNHQPELDLLPHVEEQTPIARYGTFLISVGLLLMVILVWFVLSCRNNSGKNRGGKFKDDDGPGGYSSELRGYSREFQGVSTNDDSDDDEGYSHKRR